MNGMRENAHRKRLLRALLYGGALSAALLLGQQLERHDSLLTGRAALTRLALYPVLTGVLSFLTYRLLPPVAGLRMYTEGAHTERRRYFRSVFAGLVLCQIPVLLGVFPGFFVYDAADELNQVLTRQFSTHHPLVHVLLMGGTVAGTHKVTGSWNAGITVYIILQMLVICAAFAAVLTELRHRGIRRGIRIASFCYLALFPTVVMYTLCSSKDGLFSAAFLLVLLLLVRWMDAPEQCLKSVRYFLAFTGCAAAMMLMRHNGFYAWLVFIPFGILLMPRGEKRPAEEAKDDPAKNTEKRKKRGGGTVRVTVLLVTPAIAAFVINHALATVLHAEGEHHQEKLTVPIMQMARLYAYDRDAYAEADAALLRAYLPEENLLHYTPRLSDLVKVGFNNERYESDSASFWRLWAKQGKAHPLAYLNAWLMTSYGYWYPGAVINVYRGNEVYTFTYRDSSYFGYETEPPGTRISLLPPVDALYRRLSIGRFQQNIPVLSLLFSPAFYFWLHLLFAIGSGRKRRVVLWLPLLLYWLTLLAGPTYLVRYTVILFESVVLYPLMAGAPDRPCCASACGQTAGV